MALDAFGAERMMWASDVTSNQTGETWAELLFAVVENPELSGPEREWLLDNVEFVSHIAGRGGSFHNS
jgi:hypothetical protein